MFKFYHGFYHFKLFPRPPSALQVADVASKAALQHFCGAMQRGRWSPGFHVVEGLGKQEALEFLISMGVRQISYSQTLGSINYLD